MATERVPELRVLQKLYQSEHSQVDLVECRDATYDKAVRKTRSGGSDFETEVSIHQAMDSCSSLFPKVLYANLETRIMLLEYCHKGTLETVIATMTEPWPPKRVYNLLVQLLIALNSLHRLAIAHCDLKASHILIGDDKSPKLTGFRLVRQITLSNGYYDDACIKDLSDLGRVVTDLVNCCLGWSRQNMKEYFAQFLPLAFGEVVHILQTPSKLRTTKAIDLLNKLIEHSDSEGWLHSETLSFLTEFRVEQSLSKFTITGVSAISSSHQSMIQRTSLFSIGKTIGGLIANTLGERFSQVEVTELCRALASDHYQLNGRFTVSLKDRKVECRGTCARLLYSRDMVRLQCAHRFCRDCLSVHLQQALAANTKYSQLQCLRCEQRLEPLEEYIMRVLPPDLVTSLTDSYLSETTRPCPKCRFKIEVVEFPSPVCVNCPKCRTGVCSYCFHKSHSFSCSKYKEDLKRKT